MGVRAEWGGGNAKDNMFEASYETMQKVLLLAEGMSKKLCPVDTGRLRASITHEITVANRDKIRGLIGTNVEYAAHVEYGTFRQAPQPFLRDSADAAMNKGPSILQAEIAKRTK